MSINQKTQIKAINSNLLENIFEEAKSRYKELNFIDINLRFGNQRFFTMHALIELKSIFSKKRKYYVLLNLKRKDILSKLSKKDFMGWFGHELAHIVEYEKKSTLKLFLFSLRYVFDVKYRFYVEKRVNAFAFNNGFTLELFRVWRKFLSMEGINIKYKRYIIKNYCPKWENIREAAQNKGISKQEYESLK